MNRLLLLCALLAGITAPAAAQFGSRLGFGKNLQYIVDHGTFTPSGSWNFSDTSTVILPSGTVIIGGATVFVDTPILGDGSEIDHLRLDSSSVTLIGPNALDKTGDTMTGNLTLDGAYLQMDTDLSSPAWAEGRVFWDKNAKTISLYNEESETTLQLGQESTIRARNKELDTILNGQVVYISGAAGYQTEIKRAIASNVDVATTRAIGVATHDIEQNTIGYITTLGLTHSIDTSAFSEGDYVFLSTFTAGGLTLDPGGGNYQMSIGVIVRSSLVNGIIMVMPGRHYKRLPTVNDYGAKTADELRALSCSTLPCQAHNTDDHDMYTATGTASGQWRNTRLGIGP